MPLRWCTVLFCLVMVLAFCSAAGAYTALRIARRELETRGCGPRAAEVDIAASPKHSRRYLRVERVV